MSIKTAVAKQIIKSGAKKAGEMSSKKSSSASTSKKDNKSLSKKNTKSKTKTAKKSGYDKFMDNHVVSDVVLPVIGDVASVAGNVGGAYNSILGAALQAVASDPDNSVGLAKDLGINRFANAALRGAGGNRLFQGAMFKTIGDTVANRFYTLADIARDRQINNETQAHEKKLADVYGAVPAGAYYDYQRSRTGNIPKTSGDLKK